MKKTEAQTIIERAEPSIGKSGDATYNQILDSLVRHLKSKLLFIEEEDLDDDTVQLAQTLEQSI